MDSVGDDNLGLLDGRVEHAEVNAALARADKVLLYGEQTRLPLFVEDRPLDKLHAGDPRVLLFWKSFAKIPPLYREAFFELGLGLTLCRGEDLLFFATERRHQGLHVGLRRTTVYIPEVLLKRAALQGYDHWSLAEGLVYGLWLLFDYCLLVGILERAAKAAAPTNNLWDLGDRHFVRRLAAAANRHRLAGDGAELEAFTQFYAPRLQALKPDDIHRDEAREVARRIFAHSTQQQWARDKVEQIARIFNYPRMFLCDRDLIHGAARQIARDRGHPAEPQSYAEAVHDYRDARRFSAQRQPVHFAGGVTEKAQALVLEQTVRLGLAGLVDFFAAYRRGQAEARQLMQPLWIYLCRLSSDPAGVYARVGRCRALGVAGREEGVREAVAGVLLRLDKAPFFADLITQVKGMGEAARAEVNSLLASLSLSREDEWAVFKWGKQGIVERASEVMESLGQAPRPLPSAVGRRLAVHEDERLAAVLAGQPHRLSSDPVGVLGYYKAYQEQKARHGPADPDVSYLLAGLLLRLDQSEDYEHFLTLLLQLGAPAVWALFAVFEQLPDDGQPLRPYMRQTQRLLSRALLRSGSKKRQAS